MRVFRYDDGGRDIAHHGSRGFTHVRLAQAEGAAFLSCARLEPGGVIGRHPAGAPQLLVVVEGSGYVSGADGRSQPIQPGYAVRWDAGEEHETRTDTGLVALILEAQSLDLPSA